MGAAKGIKYHTVNHNVFARVIKALMHEPQTLTMLEESVGLHRVTLQRLFRALREHRIVHISGWEPDSKGRDASHIFSFGAGRDKPRFCMTASERSKRRRERLKRKEATQDIDNLIKGVSLEKRTDPKELPAGYTDREAEPEEHTCVS